MCISILIYTRVRACVCVCVCVLYSSWQIPGKNTQIRKTKSILGKKIYIYIYIYIHSYSLFHLRLSSTDYPTSTMLTECPSSISRLYYRNQFISANLPLGLSVIKLENYYFFFYVHVPSGRYYEDWIIVISLGTRGVLFINYLHINEIIC